MRGEKGWVYDEVRIDQITPGDEILSLNEATGRFQWARVKALMDMGVKPIYKLTTASGKTIRTTGNHPYLVRADESARYNKADESARCKQNRLSLFERGLVDTLENPYLPNRPSKTLIGPRFTGLG